MSSPSCYWFVPSFPALRVLTVDAHGTIVSKVRRKCPSNLRKDGKHRTKDRPRGPRSSNHFLRFILFPLGQKSYQYQIVWIVSDAGLLHQAHPGAVLLVRVYLSKVPFVRAQVAITKASCSYVASIVLQSTPRGVVVTSLLTKASPKTRSFLSVSHKLTGKIGFLYTLDTLPLLLAIVIYIPFWPTKYIEQHHGMSKENLEMNAGLCR